MTLDNVLIVEDEPIMAYGLKIRFEKWGFRNVEVVESCASIPKYPDDFFLSLVVIDIDSHNQDHCLETVLRLQQRSPLAILFLVTPTNRLDTKLLKNLQRYQRVNKPCRIPQLRQAVEQLLSVSLSDEERA